METPNVESKNTPDDLTDEMMSDIIRDTLPPKWVKEKTQLPKGETNYVLYYGFASVNCANVNSDYNKKMFDKLFDVWTRN